uniref:hypothetical protein n=1 Tax=Streptomyces shenzhenensis TaxID=943815 RepID=UPI001C6900FC
PAANGPSPYGDIRVAVGGRNRRARSPGDSKPLANASLTKPSATAVHTRVPRFSARRRTAGEIHRGVQATWLNIRA